MSTWREQKRAALGDIHQAFVIPAVYLTHAAGTPVRVNVRLHRAKVSGDVEFTDAAAYLDATTRIVFDQTELPEVLGKSYVIFGNTEAYRTGPSASTRDGYTRVEVSDVSQADLTTLLNAIDIDDPAFEGILS